jgi:3-oxoacyl-[acyl-carrier protein] reductase
MKTALITGSTKGIGKQVGIDLLNKGYFVYFNYANNDSEALKLEHELLDKYENQYRILKADLSDSNNVINLVLDIHNLLDIIVLNAGMTDRTAFGEIEVTKWNKVFEMNLTVPFFLIQTLKDKIKTNGRIIFISSISGIVPDSVSISYGVSKAAINMLVSYLAKVFAPKNITVNAVAPGYTMTDWHIGKDKSQLKRISDKTLLKRFATPAEISSTVLHLINNSYITGQVIQVSGGFGL